MGILRSFLFIWLFWFVIKKLLNFFSERINDRHNIDRRTDKFEEIKRKNMDIRDAEFEEIDEGC